MSQCHRADADADADADARDPDHDPIGNYPRTWAG